MKRVNIGVTGLFHQPQSAEELSSQIKTLGADGAVAYGLTWNYLGGVVDEFFNSAPAGVCPCCGGSIEEEKSDAE